MYRVHRSQRGSRQQDAPMGPQLLAAALVVMAYAATAQTQPCDAPAFRQFDFWLGEWQVRTPDGKLVGTNRITREYGGCVIHEHYTSVRNYTGESLNIYDAGRGSWHQTWVDNQGLLLLLDGGLQGSAMVLEGRTAATDGKFTRHRITWTPNADGSVRQLWESTDEQDRWTVAFDGMYTRS